MLITVQDFYYRIRPRPSLVSDGLVAIGNGVEVGPRLVRPVAGLLELVLALLPLLRHLLQHRILGEKINACLIQMDKLVDYLKISVRIMSSCRS